MAHHSAAAGHVLPNVPVWANLTKERRACVVRLLTELAHAFVTDLSKDSSKETNHADPSQTRQDSPRTP
jgi:hypothetical protein